MEKSIRKNKAVENMTKWIGFFAAVLFLTLFLPQKTVQAASNRSLSTGVTYSAYDVTGDGKADTLRLTKGGYSYGYYTTLTVSVNGQTAYTVSETYGVYSFEANLLTLDNGKVFLYISGYTDNDDGPAYILQYKKSTKKFKVIANLEPIFLKYANHFHAEVKSVSGNSIVLRAYIMSYSLAGVTFDITYNYKSGKLTQATKLKIVQVYSGSTLTANKKLTAYTSTSLKKKSFTISKGKKVRIVALYLNGKKLSIRIKAYGKYGYLAPAKSYSSTYPFKELLYAG